MDWSQKRSSLVGRIRETQLSLRPPAVHGIKDDEWRKLRRKLDRLLREYAQNLPAKPLSRCPICATPFELPIDDIGLDGAWWWSNCHVPFPEARACEHAVVFLGAVDLRGRVPTEVNVYSVLAGPGAPYVVPRLLSRDGMKAVLSTVPFASRDVGYLVVYFSEEPVPEPERHQEWRKQTWILHDEDGREVAENSVNDPWDFDIGPWIDRGKLDWIAPGDATLAIRSDRPSPYEGLPGIRQQQSIESGVVLLRNAPDGSEWGYYEPQ